MQQRLATGDHYHRCTALFDGFEAFINAQPLIEDGVGVIDLAAAGAGEVATEQRFEHQDERISPLTLQMSAGDIGADSNRLP
jgi:hypothetical protein